MIGQALLKIEAKKAEQRKGEEKNGLNFEDFFPHDPSPIWIWTKPVSSLTPPSYLNDNKLLAVFTSFWGRGAFDMRAAIRKLISTVLVKGMEKGDDGRFKALLSKLSISLSVSL